MTDYRSMLSPFIGAWDLDGKDVTVTIERFQAAKVKNKDGESPKILLFFKDSKTGKGMVVNKTNALTIAAMYGKDVSQWVGKRITLWPTTTKFGNAIKECIRVRPTIPGESRRDASPASTTDSEAPDA